MPALLTRISSLPNVLMAVVDHGLGAVEAADVVAVDDGFATGRFDFIDHLLRWRFVRPLAVRRHRDRSQRLLHPRLPVEARVAGRRLAPLR